MHVFRINDTSDHERIRTANIICPGCLVDVVGATLICCLLGLLVLLAQVVDLLAASLTFGIVCQPFFARFQKSLAPKIAQNLANAFPPARHVHGISKVKHSWKG